MRPPPRKARAKTAKCQPPEDDPPIQAKKRTFEEVFYGDDRSNISSSTSDFSDYDRPRRKRKKKAKGHKVKNRKSALIRRSPTPEAPEMSDLEIEMVHEEEPGLSQNRAKHDKEKALPSMLRLQFQGLSEAITINLAELYDQTRKRKLALTEDNSDESTLVEVQDIASITTAEHSFESQSSRSAASLLRADPRYACFLEIEPNIRNRIYRLLLVGHIPVQFSPAKRTAKTASILRACQQIHVEARTILYGENCFHFERVNSKRGTYYDTEWKEIGYKDIRRFLEDIGEQNRACMRYITIEFADAAPYLTPCLDTAERRFVNDPVVLRILNMIGSSEAVLDRFVVGFAGRQSVQPSDFHFLKALTRIRCYKLEKKWNWSREKVSTVLFDHMKEVMEVPTTSEVDEKLKKRTAKMLHEKPTAQQYTDFCW